MGNLALHTSFCKSLFPKNGIGLKKINQCIDNFKEFVMCARTIPIHHSCAVLCRGAVGSPRQVRIKCSPAGGGGAEAGSFWLWGLVAELGPAVPHMPVQVAAGNRAITVRRGEGWLRTHVLSCGPGLQDALNSGSWSRWCVLGWHPRESGGGQ